MGGGSQPTSQTTVKGGKPFIAREYYSPDFLRAQAELAKQYGQRADIAEASRRETMNRTMAMYGETPYYAPYKTAEGNVIATDTAAPRIDPSSLVVKDMFQTPQYAKEENKSDSKNKKQENYLASVDYVNKKKVLTDLGR